MLHLLSFQNTPWHLMTNILTTQLLPFNTPWQVFDNIYQNLVLLSSLSDSPDQHSIQEKSVLNFSRKEKTKIESFEYFHPVSLFNLINKVICNFIASILKLVLSTFLSKEQFGFLINRQIFYTVEVAQECMHSIKQTKIKEMILKVDLAKSYDRVD